MYPNDDRADSPDEAESSFGGSFLEGWDEDDALPLIEEETLSPGYVEDFELLEASLDEPLPGLDKVLIPREEEWTPETAGFHGAYEKAAEAQARKHREEEEPDDFGDPEATLAALMGGESQDEPEDSFDDSEPFGDEPVDTDSAFDDIEDQDEDDEDDVEALLAVLAPNKKSSSNDEDEDDEEDSQYSNKVETNFSFKSTEEDQELMQGFEIDEIISMAIDLGASDIHIIPERRIFLRINGEITKAPRFDVIPAEITRRIQQKIVTNVADDIFLEHWELDTSYTVRTGKHRGRRVRVVVVKTFEEVDMVMRIISEHIPLPADLEIEDELLEWSEMPNGLVLMNGPTGTGKSTTLASVIQNIQLTRACNIITVEKPVEYVYKNQGLASMHQREVGRDTLSFGAALDSAMRMDPDVILIGEVRNAVEMDALLYAADTGHLSLSTTHANSAAESVNRIKRMFSGDEQRQAMETMATVARGLAAQVLCKTVDGKSRFAVREILSVTPQIEDLILQGDNRGIRRLQEERKITLDHGLVKAVIAGRTTREDARAKSPNPRYFDALFSERSKSF